MFGRTVVYTDELNITVDNVVDVLQRAESVHAKNRSEINYLWDYYKGKTPILNKTKEVRANINHKVVVNRANEVVTFKKGYGFGEPIQYIRRGQKDDLTDDIGVLNDLMFGAGKHSKDSSLAEWMFVCGVGMRMVLPSASLPYADEEVPFSIFTLDPRNSFVVRYNGLGDPVVMGVKYVEREHGERLYSCYTRDMYYEIENGIITKAESHVLGRVPIFEYPANEARLGCFEIALPLLDAINEIESNRMDDLEQYVNSFLALLGGTIDEETASKLNEYKMLCLPEGTDAKYLSSVLQQTDTQVMADSYYEYVLSICGVPNRSDGGSGGDNGVAVIYRNGYETAESHMKNTEMIFRESEKDFLRMVLRIMRDTVGTNLSVADIDIKFSRRNYDNLLTKAQVLTTMLNSPKIHPELAFSHSGLFLDPESAYLQSKEWWENNEAKVATEEVPNETDSLSEVQ